MAAEMQPLRPAQVVVLNGVGSVGKSSMARALQRITAAPFLHVPMDAFLDMLPPALFGSPDGLVFEPAEHDGPPCLAIRSGPVLDRAMRGMRRAVAAMAAEGNNLIVDDVMTRPEQQAEYRALLAGVAVRFVGLFAPLAVLEARERQRGDRQPGLARWQFGRVHRDRCYDLRLDTTMAPPQGIAERIRDAFQL